MIGIALQCNIIIIMSVVKINFPEHVNFVAFMLVLPIQKPQITNP